MSSSLRSLRRAAGLTQKQLAARAGLDQTAISALERGDVADPRTSTIQRLARGLDLPLEAVITSVAATRRHRRRRGPIRSERSLSANYR